MVGQPERGRDPGRRDTAYPRWDRIHTHQGSIVQNGNPSQGRNDEQQDHIAAQLAFLWIGAVTSKELRENEDGENARGRPRKKADRWGKCASEAGRVSGRVQALGHH
jgi:hypothetical protein